MLAHQWYLEGLRTLDDVRDRKKLSPHQEVCDRSRSVLLGFLVTDGLHSLKLGFKYYDGRVPNYTTCKQVAHYGIGRSE